MYYYIHFQVQCIIIPVYKLYNYSRTLFTQGNAPNQTVAFDNKVIDYINYILRNKQYKTCQHDDIIELQSAMYQLIKAMSEENRSDRESASVSALCWNTTS